MKKRDSWKDIYAKIQEDYPVVVSMDWGAVFTQESDVFAKVVSDLIKTQSDVRSGKRRVADRTVAEAEFRRLQISDYAELPFAKSFRALSGTRSIRNISFKTGLEKSTVQRLLTEQLAPTVDQMRCIAQAFRKDPSYFLEYRMGTVLASIKGFMEANPETATVWYHKAKNQGIEIG